MTKSERNEYMREWRKTHSPKKFTEEQRLKRNAYMRAYCKKPENLIKSLAYNKKYLAAHPEKRKQYSIAGSRSEKGRYGNLKGSAKFRNIEMLLSFDEWKSLISNPCHYCNRDLYEPCGTSIDRKDNELGYTTENSVQCCGECNRVKGNILSYAEMKYLMPLLMEFRKVG